MDKLQSLVEEFIATHPPSQQSIGEKMKTVADFSASKVHECLATHGPGLAQTVVKHTNQVGGAAVAAATEVQHAYDNLTPEQKGVIQVGIGAAAWLFAPPIVAGAALSLAGLNGKGVGAGSTAANSQPSGLGSGVPFAKAQSVGSNWLLGFPARAGVAAAMSDATWLASRGTDFNKLKEEGGPQVNPSAERADPAL